MSHVPPRDPLERFPDVVAALATDGSGDAGLPYLSLPEGPAPVSVELRLGATGEVALAGRL